MKSVLLIILSLISIQAIPQTFLQRFDGINFSINGNDSYAPFNGGQNSARYQFIDIDGDADLDLFMFDSDTTLYFYQNTGTPQNSAYKLMTTRFQNLSFKNWFYFVKIDSDNDYDLFAGGEFQTVKYYRNDGTSQAPSFTLVFEELRSSGDTTIFSESNCVPTFCDIDADGDKDFFTGQSLGTITYYENIGSSSNFLFRYVTDFWQNLIIISPASTQQQQIDSKIGNGDFLNLKNDYAHTTDDSRHGANSLEFTDIDNDNDFDLFWGDLFSKGIYFIQNNGTPTNPNVAIVDSIYPHNSPFISKGYNSTRFVDIDADGDKDMFISVLYLAQNLRNFAFYRNNGNASVPNFQRMADDYLNNVDAGGNSNLRFVDIDADGDKDLFMGNDFAKLAYFRNTGTSSSPAFTQVSDSLPILSSSFNYSPSFGDLDNDGDQDMILGSYIKDSIWFFRNTGTPQNFIFTFAARGRQIGIDSVGQSSNPSLVDIDNDNDKDLFIGATNGRIFFYENTGTSSDFVFTFRSAFYAGIDVGTESIPRFFDIDNDGDFDLFAGEEFGKISYYRNEGTSSSPNFIFQTNNYKNINVNQNSCPDFVDIDNDTDPDLFIGNFKGGIFYFRNDDINSVKSQSRIVISDYYLKQNFPNPFNPSTVISFNISPDAKQKMSNVKIVVFDITGKKIAELMNEMKGPGEYSVTFNAAEFSSGIYFYRLFADETVIDSKKMLYVK